MTILGISAGYHDCGVTVIDNGEILFAGHAERYSKKKHDEHINIGIFHDALKYGLPETIAYYERPWLKQMRQAYAGQDIEWDKMTADLATIRRQQEASKHLSPSTT